MKQTSFYTLQTEKERLEIEKSAAE